MEWQKDFPSLPDDLLWKHSIFQPLSVEGGLFIFYSGKPELHEYIHVWGTAIWPVSLFRLWERRAHIFDMGGAVGPFSILPALISAGSGEK